MLREWQFRRELVNSYSRSLLLLALDGDGARQREARRELNEKLDAALLALRHASDQLEACERDRVLARSAR
jgi:hypothetical protein